MNNTLELGFCMRAASLDWILCVIDGGSGATKSRATIPRYFAIDSPNDLVRE